MLKLKPNCEYCDKDLPPDAQEARICSYECTYCAGCVEEKLFNVCPNCGGGFWPRPIRPKTARRNGVGLAHQPASVERVHLSHDKREVEVFCEAFRLVDPAER